MSEGTIGKLGRKVQLSTSESVVTTGLRKKLRTPVSGESYRPRLRFFLLASLEVDIIAATHGIKQTSQGGRDSEEKL